jgi:hypothetical protein
MILMASTCRMLRQHFLVPMLVVRVRSVAERSYRGRIRTRLRIEGRERQRAQLISPDVSLHAVCLTADAWLIGPH